ncbi:hypothetical protein KY360_07535, partial [Candidatus Woesearchaeota archaeon]|nr:hypothetical protein [Candidatus Woesearchaeota archaeon]
MKNKPNKKIWNKLFSIVVIILFFGTFISADVVVGAETTENVAAADGEEKEEKPSYEDLMDDPQRQFQLYPTRTMNERPNVAAECCVNTMTPNQFADLVSKDEITSEDLQGMSDAQAQRMLVGPPAPKISPDDMSKIPPDKIDALGPNIAKMSTERKAALTSDQLAQGDVLDNVGDLNNLNHENARQAIIQKHGLDPNLQITVIEGVTYKDGVLFNKNFQPKGFPIDSVKNDPNIVSIGAVADPSDPNINGFVLRTADGESKIMTASTVGAITGFDIDSDGNTIVHTDQGDFTLKAGEIDGVIDAQGNSVFSASEGTHVAWGGFDFVAQGSEGFKTEFSFEGGNVKVNGPVTISRGADSIINQQIEGESHFGTFEFRFGDDPGDFYVEADRAELQIGEDHYSGHFSTEYKGGNLIEFSLNSQGSSATIRGHLRITNDDGIPKTFVTQYHPDADRIEQVWHNSAVLITFNEERARIEELTDEEVAEYVSSTVDKNQNEIDALNKQLSEEDLTDAQRAQIESRIRELERYNSDIEGLTTKSALQDAIKTTIDRLEQENHRIWSDLPNTGLIEYNTDDTTLYPDGARTTDTMPQRMVILPGRCSYGVHGSGDNNDVMSFSGAQDGVYSIFSPRKYSEESGTPGDSTKRGIIYQQAGKAGLTGDFGTARAKTNLGLIEVTSGRDDSGNSYTKLSRSSIAPNNIADTGLIIVGPTSNEPRTAMIRLDQYGIHAIDQLVGNEQGQVHTDPSKITEKADRFERNHEAAIGIVSAVLSGEDLKKALEKIMTTFVEEFEDLEEYIREAASGVSPEVLDSIIKINTLKVDGNTEELQNLIDSGDLDDKLEGYAKEALLGAYDAEGRGEEADALLDQWIAESPTDESLKAMKSQRDQAKALTQATAGLTGQESIEQLQTMLEKGPNREVLLRLSQLYSQEGDTAKAQEYAELARRELTLGIERAEFNIQQMGFGTIFDFSEKATEINQRLAETSFANNDFTMAEDTARFNLAIDKRNYDAQQILGASLVKMGENQENVNAWEKFAGENKDDDYLHTKGTVGLIDAYALNKDYDKAKEVYNNIFRTTHVGELEDELRGAYVRSMNMHAQDVYAQAKEASDEPGDYEGIRTLSDKERLLAEAASIAREAFKESFGEDENAEGLLMAIAAENMQKENYDGVENLLKFIRDEKGELSIDQNIMLASALANQESTFSQDEGREIYDEIKTGLAEGTITPATDAELASLSLKMLEISAALGDKEGANQFNSNLGDIAVRAAEQETDPDKRLAFEKEAAGYYIRAEEYEEAKSILTNIIESDPYDETARKNLLYVYQRSGDKEGIREQASALGHMYRRQVEFGLGTPEEKLEQAATAAQFFQQAGDTDSIVRVYESLVDSDDKSVRASANAELGDLARAQSESRARRYYYEALRNDPDNEQAILGRAEIESKYANKELHRQAHNDLIRLERDVMARNQGKSVEEYSREDQMLMYRVQMGFVQTASSMAKEREYVVEEGWISDSGKYEYDRDNQDSYFNGGIASAEEAERIATIMGNENLIRNAQLAKGVTIVSQHQALRASENEYAAEEGYWDWATRIANWEDADEYYQRTSGRESILE